MEKKEFKFYEAPKSGVVEMKLQSNILVGSTNAKGVEEDEWDDEEG